MERVAVVEVSPAGRACVGTGILLFIGALVLVGFNESSIASAHGQLFSITQAAQHVSCDATEKSVAKLGASSGAQPVFLSCPVSQVADLAKNPQLSVFAPLLGEARGLEIKVDTKILQWVEKVNPECVEDSEAPSLVEIGAMRVEMRSASLIKRRGLSLDRYLTADVPSAAPAGPGSTGSPSAKPGPTEAAPQSGPTPPKDGAGPARTTVENASDSLRKGDSLTPAQTSDKEVPKCVYTYTLSWATSAMDGAKFGCAPDRLKQLQLSDADCLARCQVPNGGTTCAALGVANTGRIADALLSRTVQPSDGDVIVGGGYQLTKGFLDASAAEWDPAPGHEVNGDKLPQLSLVSSVGVEEIKTLLSTGADPVKGNIEVDHKSAGLFLSLATRGETVGDVRTHFQARLLPLEHTVSVLAAMSKDGDQTRIVPWETGLAKPVDKIAWIDFSKTTLDNMVAERIFSLNGVKPLSSWMMRVSGWSMVYVGLVMVCWPLSVAPEIFPGLGKCVAGADAAPLLSICAAMALFSSLLVTSICWMFSGLTVRGLWLLGGALLSAVPMVLFCTCLVPKERSSKRASYLEGSISISALRQSTSSLGRSSSAR